MSPSVLVPGRVLGGYRLEAPLGRGGMGEVWSAHDVALGRRVAIKVLRGAEGDDAHLHERFVREGRAAAALVHPSVVTVFATGETDGVAWLAMELVEGKTLRAVAGGASLETRIGWLAALAAGLDAVHRAGFVHRDVKPDNVMITHDGRLKLLDFGLVRPPPGAAPLTATGYVMGTPRYMAPEQWRGEAMDARVDQFAWGLVAFELLSGRHPDDCSVGFGRLASWVAPARPIASVVRELPPDVGYLVDRALSVRAADRFGAMQEIVAAFGVAFASGPRFATDATRAFVDVPARPELSASARAASAPRVLVFLAGFSAVVLVSPLAAAVVLVVRPRTGEPVTSAASVPAPPPAPSSTPTPVPAPSAESATPAAPPAVAPPRPPPRPSPPRARPLLPPWPRLGARLHPRHRPRLRALPPVRASLSPRSR